MAELSQNGYNFDLTAEENLSRRRISLDDLIDHSAKEEYTRYKQSKVPHRTFRLPKTSISDIEEAQREMIRFNHQNNNS